MTLKEFEKLRLSIERVKFVGDSSNPITYGIERAVFEKEKFKKLIAAAKPMEMKMARTKLELWKRQLERANQSHARFKKIQDEIRAMRIDRVVPTGGLTQRNQKINVKWESSTRNVVPGKSLLE